MPSLLSNLSLLHSLASLLELSFPSHKAKSHRLRRNIRAITALFPAKAFLLWHGYPLIANLYAQQQWGDVEWGAWSHCVAAHTSIYLFDATYRFDLYILGHHLSAIPLLHLPLFCASPSAAAALAQCTIPFWIPGVVIGDTLEEISYLLHKGVLDAFAVTWSFSMSLKYLPFRCCEKEAPPKKAPARQRRRILQRIFGILTVLTRTIQWAVLAYAIWSNRDEHVVRWTAPLLSVFACYEVNELRRVIGKAWIPL